MTNRQKLITCYKSNSRRGSVDRNAVEMKILYFYRAMVEAATGFIANRCSQYCNVTLKQKI